MFLFLVEELEETVDLALEEGEGERNCDSTTMATATVIVMAKTRWRLQHFHLGTNAGGSYSAGRKSWTIVPSRILVIRKLNRRDEAVYWAVVTQERERGLWKEIA